MRKWFVFGLVVFSCLWVTMIQMNSTPLLYAADTGVVDAGNKFCPVSGDKVSGKHFVEHQGKRYGLCCPACANKFKANPEKYMAQMAEQEQMGGDEGHHEHHH